MHVLDKTNRPLYDGQQVTTYNMYDICIVGSGIVGKYLAHQLKGKNICWVSGRNSQLQSKGEYKIENYLGEKDTWQERAAGIVSFPTPRDIESFPFDWQTYKQYQDELVGELQLQSLASLRQLPEYQTFLGSLESIFLDRQTQFFWNGYHPQTGPDFTDRETYDRYWWSKKPVWDFSPDISTFVQAQYFEIDKNRAVVLVGMDAAGREVKISAKRYILATNTPGTLAILDRTYRHNGLRGRNLLGRYYSEHAQTSFGLLVPSVKVPRTALYALCYQDREYQGLPYRLEFHMAPPKTDLLDKTQARMPAFTKEQFRQSFLRMTLVYYIPPMRSSRLHLKSPDYQRVSANSVMLKSLKQQRNTLVAHVRQQFLSDNRVVVLNRHFPFYFAGHLTGGIAYPEMVDVNFNLKTLPNISIASSAVFPTNGLFNPTFATLACAKHILAKL